MTLFCSLILTLSILFFLNIFFTNISVVAIQKNISIIGRLSMRISCKDSNSLMKIHHMHELEAPTKPSYSLPHRTPNKLHLKIKLCFNTLKCQSQPPWPKYSNRSSNLYPANHYEQPRPSYCASRMLYVMPISGSYCAKCWNGWLMIWSFGVAIIEVWLWSEEDEAT